MQDPSAPAERPLDDAEQRALRARARASVGGTRDDAIDAYLAAYKPAAGVFDWGPAAGASCAVPFDRVMWRCAAAACCRRAGCHARAAQHMRAALTNDFAGWTHRGVESRMASEPRAYALYCMDRGTAAMGVLCRPETKPSPSAMHLSSYAALMFKTASLLGLDNDMRALQALGKVYSMYGYLAIDRQEIGRAVGSLRVAQQIAQVAGGTEPLLHPAECRNDVVQEDVVAPDSRALVVPRTLGGGAAV